MRLIWTLETFRWSDVPDVLVVAAIIFAASFLMRGTQAIPLLRGTIVVVLITGFFASVLDWVAFRWLLNNVITATAVAIPVIFQPELRRALERLGRTRLSQILSRTPNFTQDEQVIEAICAAAARLSERRHGALIVLERNDSLEEYIKTGVPLDSQVSPQLFLTVFWPKTELHDGAVIIRNGRVASAASVLPLSSGRNLTDRKLGTRHRAGLGISEVSDGLCVIVSEETGRISVANRGRMIRRLDANRLRTILSAFYTSDRAEGESPWLAWLARWRNGGGSDSTRRAA
ncbi:MAG TPA: diadenylate cyclase CdaA [Aggregatilineaceae bacterium]|nr:diadenylate cyclase CdaA [Aggregatilineaceae bacterium]